MLAQAANETLNQSMEAFAADAANEVAVLSQPVVQNVIQPNIAVWFLYGAVFAIIIFVVRDLLSAKRK
jgi:hypothetical protein